MLCEPEPAFSRIVGINSRFSLQFILNKYSSLIIIYTDNRINIFTGPDKPHVDTEEVIQCIKQVFKKFLPALSGLIEGLLQTVVSEMLAVGLIPRAVEKNPSSDAILSFFLSGLDFKDELEEIEEYCVLFFSVFHEISGQFADAGAKINKTIQKMVRDKLGVRFNIDLGMYMYVSLSVCFTAL